MQASRVVLAQLQNWKKKKWQKSSQLCENKKDNKTINKFSQSEMEKYFEWMMNIIIIELGFRLWHDQ